MRALSATL